MSRVRIVVMAAVASVSVLALACSSFSGSDPGAASDGGPDDANAASVDAGSAHFCATQDAEYCADFDLKSATYGAFVASTSSDASLVLTNADFVSPPNALSAGSVPQVDDSGMSTAWPRRASRPALVQAPYTCSRTLRELCTS
jgi:hypothetical protein